MKKLVAIVLTLAMLTSCIPVMAFAEEKAPHEQTADAYLHEIQDLLFDEMKNEKFVDTYLWLSGEVDKYKGMTDMLMQALKLIISTEKTDPEIAEWMEELVKEGIHEQLDDYIAEGNRRIQELEDKPAVKAAIEQYLHEVEMLDQLLRAYEINPDDYYPESIWDAADSVLKAYDDAWKLANKEFIFDALDLVIQETKEIMQQNGAYDEKVEEIFEKIEMYEIIAYMYASMDPDEAIDDLMEKARAALETALDKAMEKFLEELDKFLDELEKNGVTKEEVEKYIEIAKEVAKYAEMYKEIIEDMKKIDPSGFDPQGIIDGMIEYAEALVAEYQDVVVDAAIDAATELMGRIMDGEFDKYLEPIGISGDHLIEIILDVIAYGYGLSQGELYTELQWDLMIKEFELEDALINNQDLKDTITELENKIAGIEKDNTALRKQIEELSKKSNSDKAVIKKFVNGYNLTKKKPTLKKLKNIKKKKIKVTFKGIKKLNATKYQIKYKYGKKKAKTKTYKKATKTNKTLKYTLKKLKKGKKYTVKVRAVYTFKYNKKTYKFYSKWSKSKKVKVKK